MALLNAYYQYKGGAGIQRKGAYAGPYKVYDLYFLAKRGIKIAHPVAEIYGKRIKGQIVYKDIISDSGSFRKNDTITLRFPDRNMNNNVSVASQGSPRLVGFKKDEKDDYITISFFLNNNRVWVKARVYEKKRPENEQLLQ